MKLRVFSDVKVQIRTEDIHKSNVVYKLTFPSGKCYIGLTTQKIETRVKDHCRDSFYNKSDCFNTKKARAIRKYMTFSVDILYEGDDIKEQEIYFIKEFDSQQNGYNTTAGGDGTNGLSKETYELIASKNRGKKRSEETKRKMSEAAIGKVFSDETRAKLSITNKKSHNTSILQYDLNNVFIKEYTSIADANKELGKNPCSSAISNNINGRSKKAYGFIWKQK